MTTVSGIICYYPLRSLELDTIIQNGMALEISIFMRKWRDLSNKLLKLKTAFSDLLSLGVNSNSV